MNIRALKTIIYLACLAILWMTPLQGHAQKNRSDLEHEKAKLEDEIEYTATLINNTRNEKKNTLNHLTLLSTRIEKRRQLIDNYRKELNLVRDTLFNKLIAINRRSEDLKQLKNEYARMIRGAYRNQNLYQRMLYVMAAESFNQAYHRMNYYRYYARKRREQAEQIRRAEEKYMAEAELLEQKAGKTEKLIANLNRETTLLQAEKDQKSRAILLLADKEKELIDNQKQLETSARELKEKIEQIIAEEMAAHGGSSEPSTVLTLTPEEKLLSGNFAANRGKLPWPSERGVIASRFGEHNHPDIEGIKIKNNGIDILTQRHASARAVFDGQVTRVMTVPNFNHVVIVRHGEYLTVYSNLDEVLVKTGSHVQARQEIGIIHTDEENSKTELHFEIWKGKGLLDPSAWLATENSSGLLRIDAP